MESGCIPNDHMNTEPGADRGPRAVVDATGSDAQLEWQDAVATAPGSVPKSAPVCGEAESWPGLPACTSEMAAH